MVSKAVKQAIKKDNLHIIHKRGVTPIRKDKLFVQFRCGDRSICTYYLTTEKYLIDGKSFTGDMNQCIDYLIQHHEGVR